VAVPDTLPIRAAMHDAGEHPGERVGIRAPLYESRYAAHELAQRD
jgi:hypothetical protein